MVSIWNYGQDLFGNKTWQFAYNIQFDEYEKMASSRPGEGTKWRADFKF